MLRSALAFCAGAAVVHVLPAPWPPAVTAVLAVGAACCMPARTRSGRVPRRLCLGTLFPVDRADGRLAVRAGS